MAEGLVLLSMDVVAELQREQTIVNDAARAALERGESIPLSGMPGFETWRQRVLREAGEGYQIVAGQQVPL